VNNSPAVELTILAGQHWGPTLLPTCGRCCCCLLACRWHAAAGLLLLLLPDEMGVSSLHVTFPTGDEWAALGALGFQQRRGIQYHWCAPHRIICTALQPTCVFILVLVVITHT
jgi:hypothetical protein